MLAIQCRSRFTSLDLLDPCLKDKEAIHGRGKLEWRNGDLLDSWFSKGEIAGVVTTGLCCFTKTAPCLHTYTFANGSEYTGLITGGR